MNWLINRLKERTTWLAIFTLAGLAGIRLEPEFRDAIINAILAVAAVVSFVFRENTYERSTDLPTIETRSKRVSNLTEEDSVLIGVHSYNELIDRGMRVSESNSKTDLPAIELQGRSDSPATDSLDTPPAVGFQRYRDPAGDRLRADVSPGRTAEQKHGWNG
jgi:hypothetical protein